MHCLIYCMRISKSVHQGVNKLLFCSSKLKTVYTGPKKRTCYSFAFSNEKKYLRKDRLTADYELIYRFKSKKWWAYAAFVSYIMIIVSPIILSYPYISRARRYYKPVDVELLLENMSTSVFSPQSQREGAVISVLAVLLNALIFVLIKRYPLRIYHNGEKYVAVYMNGFFPLITRKHCFEKARRTKSLFFFLPDSNYRLDNRNARLLVTNFRRPIDFQNMLSTPYYEVEEEGSA